MLELELYPRLESELELLESKLLELDELDELKKLLLELDELLDDSELDEEDELTDDDDDECNQRLTSGPTPLG